MTPYLFTHKVERDINNTAPVQILGERCPFRKSSIKMVLKQWLDSKPVL